MNSVEGRNNGTSSGIVQEVTPNLEQEEQGYHYEHEQDDDGGCGEGEGEQHEEDQQQEGEGEAISLSEDTNIEQPPNTLRQLATFAMNATAATQATAAAATATTISSNLFSNFSSSSPPSSSTSTTPTSTTSTDSYPTLARSQSTPFLAKLLLPVLCVACQIVFYYGQTEPMWSLNANATINVWANATEYTARRTFDVLGLDYDIPLRVNKQEDVQTFTYMFAIQELWGAKDLPGTVLPRLAAILLIVFSGFWPHLKLIMLNLTWFFGKHKTRRTTTLSWLAALGKWSLADVLVVCVMVGVLNLNWVVDPAAIKDGVINDLPTLLGVAETLYTPEQVCDKLLKLDCASQKRVAKIAKCKACKGLVGEAFGHPEWARSTGRKILNGVSTNGGGVATLRVVGMRGIYYFCGAVILSIFLSLIVDILDHKAKLHEQIRQEERRGTDGYLERGCLLADECPVRHLTYARDDGVENYNNNNNNNSFNMFNDGGLETPLLDGRESAIPTTALEIEAAENNGVRLVASSDRSVHSTKNTKLFSFSFIISSLLCASCVYLASETYTMERLVYGAGPKLLHDILGVDWEFSYSFRTLMWTTGAAKGWDYMLMATFGLFCVVGPVVRAVLVLFTVLLDQCRVASVTNLATIVQFMGSFCAWEVFGIATVMVQMLMPSITDTIIRHPACGTISEDGSCLKMEFNLIPVTFSLVVAGGISLVVMSAITSKRAIEKRDAASTYSRENLIRDMSQNHDYRISEGNEALGERSELDELVFETNQV